METLIQAVRIYSQGIGMEFVIEKFVHANKVKQKTANNGRNRTTKSRKNQNALRKENLKIFGNIESGHLKHSRKNLKSIVQDNEKSIQNQTI